MFQGLTGNVAGAMKGKYAATIVACDWGVSKAGNEQFAMTFNIEKRLDNGMLVDTANAGEMLWSYYQFTPMGNKFLLPLLAALGHEHTVSGEEISMPFTDLVEEHNIQSFSDLGEVLAPTMVGRTIGLELYVNKKDGSQGVGKGFFPVDEDDLIDFD